MSARHYLGERKFVLLPVSEDRSKVVYVNPEAVTNIVPDQVTVFGNGTTRPVDVVKVTADRYEHVVYDTVQGVINALESGLWMRKQKRA